MLPLCYKEAYMTKNILQDKKTENTFIDVFAGTSALSEGFVQNGFTPIAHIEMDKDACFTIKTRLAYHYLNITNNKEKYQNYLKGLITRDEFYSYVPKDLLDTVINQEISDNTIHSIFERIDNIMKQYSIPKVDFLIGGPPCQAFSLLSRHKKNIEKDPRCFLYIQYGEFLKKYQPKGFIFENVMGLLSSKNNHFENIKEHFKKIGYKIHFQLLDSSDYGALQNRKRIIIVGWKKELDLGFPFLESQKNNWTTEAVFEDLQRIKAGEEGKSYIKDPNEYLKKTGLRTEDDILTLHLARPLNQSDALKYKYSIEKFLYENKRVSYTDYPKEYQTMNNKNSFLDRFKVVDIRGKCHTIVAHIAKDGHYYIYPYLDTIRSISVREAARLQSFPDNFYFEGSRTAVLKQIGNAVPPLMANAIAKGIKNILCQ